MLTYLDLTNVEVKFKHNAHNYDPVAKTYLGAFTVATPEMLGLLESG